MTLLVHSQRATAFSASAPTATKAVAQSVAKAIDKRACFGAGKVSSPFPPYLSHILGRMLLGYREVF